MPTYHFFFVTLASLLFSTVACAVSTIVNWGVFELTLDGPSAGNPFVEVELSARFSHENEMVSVSGFYDGNGKYRVRFMPDTVGDWSYVTASNQSTLNAKTGQFQVTNPSRENHGPVRVAHTFHFAYADGNPYKELGTTSYAWVHQDESLQEETLKTLSSAPFNKIRFCVFPKFYEWNKTEPAIYPFEGTPPHQWDFSRFNPAFFQHFEKRIQQLEALGIEADLILFHPYDKDHWGFDRMGAANDDRYLRYVLARFSAYRNVWWSLANEFDFMKEKKMEDWDRFFRIVVANDPYGHLRSIHNGTKLYNQTHPWVTHASIQNGSAVEDPGRAVLYRDVYEKPIVYDEVKYEGNLPQRWGNLSAEEMVLRFWQGLVAGTYVGHGETYLDPHDIIWWAKGGSLHGQSPARLAFLKKIMDDGPPEGFNPIDKWQDDSFAGTPGTYYLGYFGRQTPTSWQFELNKNGLEDGKRFHVEVIDTWAMTITPIDHVFVTKKKDAYRFEDKDQQAVPLPGRPYMALRIREENTQVR